MANQPLNDQQLQALLRLKRHEQPPPGYFDDLLHAVHRRQREEMLRRPAWSLMAERVGAFFASLRRDWAYVGTMAGVLLMGVGAIRLALPERRMEPVRGTAQAQVQPAPKEIAPVELARTIPYEVRPEGYRGMSPHLREVKAPRFGQPRFVIDTQPASYEQTQIRF